MPFAARNCRMRFTGNTVVIKLSEFATRSADNHEDRGQPHHRRWHHYDLVRILVRQVNFTGSIRMARMAAANITPVR